MAQFFREKPNRSKKVSAKLSLTASGLDHQGAGIGQYQGKVVFIPGLLPGESAEVQLTEQKRTMPGANSSASPKHRRSGLNPNAPIMRFAAAAICNTCQI